MILKDQLLEIVKLQRKEIERMDPGIERELLPEIDTRLPHAAIISGVRRCGKSTLMKQIMRRGKDYCYFNFEEPRAAGFSLNDFPKLEEAFKECCGNAAYFMDEIQNVDEWERFVRRKLDTGGKFVITGSNASLLSRELGTRLTGRHITHTLFPFSYIEFLRFLGKKAGAETFEEYLRKGGFPEFLKYGKEEMLQELFNDIITKDVIVRHKIRDEKTVRNIAVFLLSNISREFSCNSLAKTFGIRSANTAVSYVGCMEESFLLFTVPIFSFSLKKQQVNPRKVYSIDTGFTAANSASFSADRGRILENAVFLHLRRKYREIFYFKGKRECDFIAKNKGKAVYAVQSCLHLDTDNMEREIEGLKEAMKTLGVKNGVIVTLAQEDKIDGINIVPAWKWFLKPQNAF
ncbi:MAG: ATP-binding protein [Candidatus Nanoarchaeia archaeon]|nr:ATP-binding protein [Candidatus Nanoarchaeia archaeon]